MSNTAPTLSPFSLENEKFEFHLEAVAGNSQGFVLGNAALKLVVLRLQKSTDIAKLLALVDLAVTTLCDYQNNVLVVDFRAIEQSDGLFCQGLMLHLASKKDVKHIGVLLSNLEKSPVRAEAINQLQQSEQQLTFRTTYEKMTASLLRIQLIEVDKWLQVLPENFQGNYGGSVYSLLELDCTVIRTSGILGDRRLVGKLFEEGIKLQEKIKTKTVIIDSSASAPITSLERYSCAYRKIILPLTSSTILEKCVHVRAGDTLFNLEAPPLEPFFASFGKVYIETISFEDALMHLKQ